MTLTIKLDGNWSSFQLANSAPPLGVTGSASAPTARMGFAEAKPAALKFADPALRKRAQNRDITAQVVPGTTSAQVVP